MSVLARDGHLLDVTIDRALTSELSEEENTDLEAHLAECATCRRRLEASKEYVEQPLPALDFASMAATERATGEPGLRVVQGGARSRNLWAIGGAGAIVLSLAAAVLLWVRLPTDTGEQFTARGGDGLFLQVMRATDDGAEPLIDNDVVHPGERLGFRVRVPEDGYLMVLGKDQAGSVYPGYPAGEAPSAATAMGNDVPLDLSVAIQLDDTLGTESLIAVHCLESFDYAEVAEPLAEANTAEALGELLEGCEQHVVRLQKRD